MELGKFEVVLDGLERIRTPTFSTPVLPLAPFTSGEIMTTNKTTVATLTRQVGAAEKRAATAKTNAAKYAEQAKVLTATLKEQKAAKDAAGAAKTTKALSIAKDRKANWTGRGAAAKTELKDLKAALKAAKAATK